MVALRRRVLMVIAGAAAAALSASAASACGGFYGYGCGAGYYGYGWGARTGYGFGYGYGYAFPAPTYSYAAPTVTYQPNYVIQPNYVVQSTYVIPQTRYVQGPVQYLDPADAYPPRYFVNQGPVYGGPNVTNFGPRYYNPGYVRTRAFPYVGGFRGAYMRPAYVGPRIYRRGVVYRPGFRVGVRPVARVYVNQTPRGWSRRTAPVRWR
jgi:hypothetical protein